MKTLEIKLKHTHYPIYIGHDLDKTLLEKHIHAKQVMIVTNETVAELYLKDLENILNSSHQCDSIILPDGEEFKNIETLMQIINQLMEADHKRTSTIIALGGGVIGDMSGFAASIYQRGMDFIQIPTSLLAQVDASVGGKTGVNHSLGKNMIGAFHQPNAVLIDVAYLQTLPDRHYSAGLAEIIKHGLIQDETFFHELESIMPKLLARNTETLIDVLYKSCQIKANIVEQDETEKTGKRALLNFGHTYAHAIETAMNYENILHGEAVAIGMLLAAELSKLDNKDVQRIEALLKAANLPTEIPQGLSEDTLIKLMKHDKKNQHKDSFRFVILNKIGEAALKDDVTEGEIFPKH